MNIATREALAHAELPTFALRGRTVLASVTKSVLWTIWALSDDRQASLRAIAVRSGCDLSTCFVAIAVLEQEGIVRKLNPARSRQRYEINTAKLRDFHSDEPLSLPPSGPKKKQPTNSPGDVADAGGMR